jgi:uncharacterized protein YecE (DUF72 family)
MKCRLYIGTSTWMQKDWVGNFYPLKTKSQDYLSEYAKRFPTVEIDSTFYATPRVSVVKSWYDKTPPDFKFSAKFPRLITHEKYLSGAVEEILMFINTMAELKEKLGALLIQLPPEFEATIETVEVMKRFLSVLPQQGFKFALEIRNRSWLKEKFYERLARHEIALTLTDSPVMKGLKVETADFMYLRWLGNRKELTEPFSETRLDKTNELKLWANAIDGFAKAKTVYGYFNNHFAGHSPSSVDEFKKITAF